MRELVVVLVVALAASVARAEDAAGVHAAAEPSEPSRHLVYVELLNKNELYGVGYEYTIAP